MPFWEEPERFNRELREFARASASDRNPAAVARLS
jgi:hypothetical protein